MDLTSPAYEALLNRRSVRRYDRHGLSPETLDWVESLGQEAIPMVPGNRYQVFVRRKLLRGDMASLLGAYGRLLNTPHFLVPYIAEGRHALLDLGFRAQQIVIGLLHEGIGSCYLGALSRQPRACRRFGLPEGAAIGAALAFGRPASLGGRVVERVVKAALGVSSRMPADQLFYLTDFASPVPPPDDLAALIQAGRWAPSAVNAQPWRFLWRSGRLYLSVRRESQRYGSRQDYRYYDGGICMANISLAMAALSLRGTWTLCADMDDVPDHPADLEPLASIALA